MRKVVLILIKKRLRALIISLLMLCTFGKSWAVEEEGKRIAPVITWLLDGQEAETPPLPSGAFIEINGLIVIEIELLDKTQGWEVKTDDPGSVGSYLEWTADGLDVQRTPENGLISAKIIINNPETYRFIWRSSIRDGSDPTESNDGFLRILADSFYGNDPNGASSDNDAHSIYSNSDQADEHEVQISAGSKHHAIDRFVLFRSLNSDNNISQSLATEPVRPESFQTP